MKPLFPLILTLSLASGACGDDAGRDDPPPYTRITAPGLDGPRIAWDCSSMRQLAPEGGYARIKPLDGGVLAAVYEGPGGAFLRLSSDGGDTWGEARKICSSFTASSAQAAVQVNIANPELLPLADGTLLCGVNYRPAQEGVAPFAIAVSRSLDRGATWSPPQVVYEAGTTFGDGCWEPAFLQLPDGTVQVYFANEGPYRTSNEQEISMLVSHDGGLTWSSEPATVSFRAGHRDGMPVPALFGEQIVVAIEDNAFGEFCPATVRTSLHEGWTQPVTGDSPQRDLCLQVANPNRVYMGAPYLTATPGGVAVLSYQSTRGRTAQWDMSCMEVAVGDAAARNFGRTTRPFDIPATKKGLWNSLCCPDAQTVIAVTSSDFQGAYSPWMIKGRMISDLAAERRSVGIDGEIGAAEWGSVLPLFVGHRGKTNVSSAVAFDEGNLYLCARVTDETRSDDDAVSFYIDALNACLTAPDRGIYRFACSASGRLTGWTGERGTWRESSFSDLRCAVQSREQGYTLEVKIPLRQLGLTAWGTMRLAVALTDSCYGSGYTEMTANADAGMPHTWCKLDFNL